MSQQLFTQVLPTVVLVNGNTACFVPTFEQITLSQPASNVLAEIVTLSVLGQSASTSLSVVGGQATGSVSLNLSQLANTSSTTAVTPDVASTLVQGQSYQVANPGLVVVHFSDTAPFSVTLNIGGQSVTISVSQSFSGGSYNACYAFSLNSGTTVSFTSTSTTTTASLYEFLTPQSAWFTTATLSWVDKLQFGFTNAQKASPYTIQALVPLNITPPVQASTTALAVSYR